jgi:hypothetical protein
MGAAWNTNSSAELATVRNVESQNHQRSCALALAQEVTMRNLLLLASTAVVGVTGTAMADEYYVVRDPSTRHCTIATTRPADREVITQIGPLAFKTRDEAEGRIKQTKVCEEGTTGSSTTTITKER